MKPPSNQATARPTALWRTPASATAVLLGIVISFGVPRARAADAPSTTNAAASVPSTPTSLPPTNTPAAPAALNGGATNTPTSSEASATAERTERERVDRNDRRSRGGDRRRSRSEGDTSGGAGGTGEISGSHTNATTGTDFASFKIIGERNIFNPNRARAQGRPDRDTARKAVQVDLITLVGALSYAKGDVAFFEGSSSEFRKALKCGDSIAGFAIRSIAPSRVKLEGGDRTLEMTVGTQLRREDAGEWKFIARADATGMPAGTASGGDSGTVSVTSSGAGSSAAPTAEASAAAGDILQRLMKKREQELK